jgi:hypothetical protein
MDRRSGALLLMMAGACAATGASPVGPPPQLRDDGYDQAYLATRRREDGCRSEDVDRCCAEVERRLARAFAVGSMEDAAVQLELQALSCHRPRPEHIARFRARVAPEKAPDFQPGRLSVRFDVRVSPEDRIYWAGAFVDGKQLITEPLDPGSHWLNVELHVLPISGIGADQLFRLRRRVQIEVPAAKTVEFSVMVRRTVDADPDRAFVMTVQGRAVEPTPADAPKAFDPSSVTTGGILTMGAIHPPTELYDPSGWAVLTKVCVAATGRVESVEPLIRMHPRDVGALVDWVMRQKHRPAQIKGVPTPYCYPLRFEVTRT